MVDWVHHLTHFQLKIVQVVQSDDFWSSGGCSFAKRSQYGSCCCTGRKVKSWDFSAIWWRTKHTVGPKISQNCPKLMFDDVWYFCILVFLSPFHTWKIVFSKSEKRDTIWIDSWVFIHFPKKSHICWCTVLDRYVSSIFCWKALRCGWLWWRLPAQRGGGVSPEYESLERMVYPSPTFL